MRTQLHYVYDYNDVDLAFWREHLSAWLPECIIDAHTHVMDPALRMRPMTEAMRKQYWVNEVLEPIPAATAERCYQTVFPAKKFKCVAFGMPDLDFDIDGGNIYVQQECVKRGWHCLVVIRPQWSQEKLAALLDMPGIIGVKPYYSLISENRDTRDAHLESGIFDFLPHHLLEVMNDRHSWITLHVPKASRLGHPQNVWDIRELRQRYPNIILVIAHLGRCYTEPHALEALPQFADDPGLYFDTSAVLNPASHRVALEHLGPDRLLYGSDNPVMYMRGRRQYQGRSYINRTSHPFAFNKDREAPEIEARYTLYMYEDIGAIKQACADLGIRDPKQIRSVFHDNASQLIESVERTKCKSNHGT